MVAAKIAGGVAAVAAMEGGLVGCELEMGMRANRVLSKMSALELDELVSYLAGKPRLIKAVEELGDIDRPSRLMARMLRHLDRDAIRRARLLGYALG